MKVATITRMIALGFPATASAFHFSKESIGVDHVTKACAKALMSRIECDGYVPDMNPNYYQKWVGDTELADKICTKTCHDSFRIWNDTVTKDCAENMNGSDFKARSTTHSIIFTVSCMWQGFNETCVKDTESGQYCQEILDGFSDIARGQERPVQQLCHPCYGKVLTVMSKSFLWSVADLYIWPPTEDDLYWQRQLELVQKKCGGSTSTAAASSESPESTAAEEPTQGPTPHGPTDPGAPSDCSFFTTITYFENCWRFASDWGITVKEFVEYVVGQSRVLRKQLLMHLRTQPLRRTAVASSLATGTYCVEVNNGYSRMTDPHKVTTTTEVKPQSTEDEERFLTLGSLEGSKQAILGKGDVNV